MLPGHTSFKAEIKKLKFETEAGVILPGTALIHLQVPGKEKPVVELMGYLEEISVLNRYSSIQRLFRSTTPVCQKAILTLKMW